jgi:hypothetical protein
LLEELERSLLIFDIVAHAVNLRKAASPEYVQNLEAVVENVVGYG